jgi:cysteine desulfurase
LNAIGYNDRIAKTGIRLTLGRSTTIEDIDWTVMVLKQVIDRSGLSAMLMKG